MSVWLPQPLGTRSKFLNTVCHVQSTVCSPTDIEVNGSLSLHPLPAMMCLNSISLSALSLTRNSLKSSGSSSRGSNCASSSSNTSRKSAAAGHPLS
jgi:hypothetical protein